MSFALIFPGQGSQFVGMGKALADWSSAARETFQEADDALGFEISRVCFEGPEDDLKLTENTQPAILTVSIAALKSLESQIAVNSSWVAGHSLGEYSALVAADSLSFHDAVKVVRERGRAMQEAVPQGKGSMAALIGMDREEVEAICIEATDSNGVVSPANYNSPGQIVIAGSVDNVRRALELFSEHGGKRAVELPVSAPFHCALMQPAATRMEQVLKDIPIDSPNTVLINNAEASELIEAGQIAPSLVRQVTSPVRWEDTIGSLAAKGASGHLEVGPGKVLTGLTRRINRDLAAVSFGMPEDFEKAAAFLEEYT